MSPALAPRPQFLDRTSLVDKRFILRDKEQILWVYGVVHIGCILFKAITYLQSAYRLKGEDAVEADDITEIAGV